MRIPFTSFHINKQAATTRDHSGWFVDWMSGGKTVSGESVTNESALALSTVYACMSYISEDIAKLPFILYRSTEDGKERATDPVSNLLKYQPNPDMTAFSFRQALTANGLGWGNGYAEIVKDTAGNVRSLWPMAPDKVTPKRDTNNRLYYEVRTDKGGTSNLWPEQVLHIPGFGFDGIQGKNVIRIARENLGKYVAMDKFGAAFFGNGANPSGSLEHPAKLSEEAQKRLLGSIERRHGGAGQSHKTLVLEEGMKFNPWSIPPEESQFIETSQFSIPDICRWFRMKPHKVADLSRATFSNIEHQSIEYVVDTLQGWARRWEMECWRKLLTPAQRDAGFFFEHLFEGLLRGDIKSRFASYRVGLDMGWLNINEVRGLENMNTIGPEGDKYLVQLNRTTLDKVGMETEVNPVNTSQFTKNAAERLVNAEFRALNKNAHLAETDKDGFLAWVDKFYSKHNEYILATLEPFGISVDVSKLTLEGYIKENIGEEIKLDRIAHLQSVTSVLFEATQNEI